MGEVFGLDFGTTNSLTAIVQSGRALSLADEGGQSYPSTVVFRGDERLTGREAKREAGEAGSGAEVVRSPKEELVKDHDPIWVGGAKRDITDVVAEVLRMLRERARGHFLNDELGSEFDEAVITIPVNLDGRGRTKLRNAAAKAGIGITQFVHEPLAALYGYFRQQPNMREEIARLEGKTILVFDWGGGTLDLTICKVVAGTLTQIQNKGDNWIGGGVFDQRLKGLVLDKHMQTHGLTEMDPKPGAEARLLEACEENKITLSNPDEDEVDVFLTNYLPEAGSAAGINQPVTRAELEELCRDLVDRGMKNIEELLGQAGIKTSAVDMVLATGGMVQMPLIRHRLTERFGLDRVPQIENGQQIIAEGAAWIANDRQPLKLAKPFELLLADDNYVELFKARFVLPNRGAESVVRQGVYCVDPRDGVARFQLARPKRPGHTQPSDERGVYHTLVLPVVDDRGPVAEKLDLEVKIDHNLVAHATASSQLTGQEEKVEIHDLEFGLSLDSHE